MPDFSRMDFAGRQPEGEFAMSASTARQHRIDVLPPEPKAGRRPVPKRDVVDADFVVIARRDTTSNDNRRPRQAPPPESPALKGALRLAAAVARLAETGLQRLPGHAFTALVIAAVATVFTFAGGLTALSAGGPAAPFAVSGLSTRLEEKNGMKVLAVYGRLDNVSGVVQAVPALDIAISGTGDRRVTPAARVLAPGEGGHFALRIPHTGGKLPDVSVSVAD